LVTVNCASIPRELFESEFFGHAKGAFTGALRDRIGRFQLADGGTIFLDEVGEIPIELQSKLLRVLQEGEIERIGDDLTRRVDVRVLAATNKDLVQEIYAGRFREDLYYRLCVFPIHLPPLRDRREDIGMLAGHILRMVCRRLNLPHVQMTDQAIEFLSAYDWPGNIREMQNVIERGAILSQEGPLRVDLVLADFRSALATSTIPVEKGNERENRLAPERVVLSKSEMEKRERENTIAALNKCNWKIYGPGGAAEILGIKPTTLSSRIKKMGLKRSAA
jgi:transcriptional regulator with GAF, ATPase, and Fis domain